MGYYIDFASISLDAYKEKLKTCHLPPSRQILREKLDERMECFRQAGIRNTKELFDTLRKKDKFTKLANEVNLSEEYLTILLRELKSLLPKPNKISEFPGIPEAVVAKIEQAGIKNTVQLFDQVKQAWYSNADRIAAAIFSIRDNDAGLLFHRRMPQHRYPSFFDCYAATGSQGFHQVRYPCRGILRNESRNPPLYFLYITGLCRISEACISHFCIPCIHNL